MSEFEQESGLSIVSLRALRGSESAIDGVLVASGATRPQAPNHFTGDADCSCAWIEPRAWLIIARTRLEISAARGLMAVELSDRFAAFRIRGAQAADVLAASLAIGASSRVLRSGCCARTKFAEEAEVFVQQLSDQPDYRLLIDVGLARFAADWLIDAAKTTAR